MKTLFAAPKQERRGKFTLPMDPDPVKRPRRSKGRFGPNTRLYMTAWGRE